MSRDTKPAAVPSATRIEAAARAIDPVFLNTPQFETDALNAQLGFRLVTKVETLNPIRSFKGRGPSWLVTERQARAQPPTRLVCASAGNFGQGMAYACRARGLALTVFAAETANPFKLERMQALGASVTLAGRDFDAAKEAARAYAQDNDLTFVEDSGDIETAEGAGTIGLELEAYPDPLDTVLVPLGNGALLNGVGAWFKAKSPATHVIGVVAAGAPAMDLSWRSGSVQTTATAETIADGIGVRAPVAVALQAMQHTVDDILQVADETLLEAMRLAHRMLGLVLEPAGAAGLAAALAYKDRFKGQLVATPLCGGNLTAEQTKRWLCASPPQLGV